MNVYFISGLGADRRAFERIQLPPQFSVHHLDWIEPRKDESLNDYAMRLGEGIDTTKPFALVGLIHGRHDCFGAFAKASPAKNGFDFQHRQH